MRQYFTKDKNSSQQPERVKQWVKKQQETEFPLRQAGTLVAGMSTSQEDLDPCFECGVLGQCYL